MIRNSRQLDQWDCLRSDFLEENSDGFLDQLLVASLEIAGVVASCHALLQKNKSRKRTQIEQMSLQSCFLYDLNILFKFQEHEVLQVSE